MVLSEGVFDLQEEWAFLDCLLLLWGQKMLGMSHLFFIGWRNVRHPAITCFLEVLGSPTSFSSSYHLYEFAFGCLICYF